MPIALTHQPTPGIAPATLWVSNGGHITCTRDGGMYLNAAVRAHPRSRAHTTPLDAWVRVTAADVAAWDAEPDLPPMVCGACGAAPSV